MYLIVLAGQLTTNYPLWPHKSNLIVILIEPYPSPRGFSKIKLNFGETFPQCFWQKYVNEKHCEKAIGWEYVENALRTEVVHREWKYFDNHEHHRVGNRDNEAADFPFHLEFEESIRRIVALVGEFESYFCRQQFTNKRPRNHKKAKWTEANVRQNANQQNHIVVPYIHNVRLPLFIQQNVSISHEKAGDQSAYGHSDARRKQ